MQQRNPRARQRDPINLYIGTRIRIRRKMLGMSQQRVAAVLGVTFQQVQKYEKGMSAIGAGHLHRLARALQVRPSFFFPESREPPGRRKEAADRLALDYLSSAEAVELNLAVVKIRDPSIRRRVIELVRTIAQSLR